MWLYQELNPNLLKFRLFSWKSHSSPPKFVNLALYETLIVIFESELSAKWFSVLDIQFTMIEIIFFSKVITCDNFVVIDNLFYIVKTIM